MNHRGCQYRITLEINFNLTLARLNPIFLCFTPIFSSCYFFWLENCLFSNNNKNQFNRTVLRNRKVSISPFLCIALTRIEIYRCFFSIVVSEQGSKRNMSAKLLNIVLMWWWRQLGRQCDRLFRFVELFPWFHIGYILPTFRFSDEV